VSEARGAVIPPAWVAAANRFDRWADDQLEPWRGQPRLAAVMRGASHLGDFSVIWHLAGALRGLTGKQRARQAVILSTLLGVESLIVNQGLKRIFRRQRPTESGDERLPVRRPSTSSFPSGHASAAAFAASLLIGWDGRKSIPLWAGLGTSVALSRVYVRIHHATDIVGGMVTGLALGAAARRLLRNR